VSDKDDRAYAHALEEKSDENQKIAEIKKKKAKDRRETNKIIKTTISAMQSLGVYRAQFDPVIKTYAELRLHYEKLKEKWSEEGENITEAYTNKAGATNLRKTATYAAIEVLRKDILSYETVLGLTPAGLKKINDNLKKGGGQTRLDKVLGLLEK